MDQAGNNGTHLSYNTSCAYCSSPSDPHSRQDDNITADPAVITHTDLFPQFWTFSPISQCRVKWMCATIDADIGSQKSSSTDGDQTGIKDDTVEVDEDPSTKLHIETIIDSNRSLNPRICKKKSLFDCRVTDL